MAERNVEHMYWDLVNLRGTVDNLAAHIRNLANHLDDLERRYDAALSQIEQAIRDNTSATLEAIDEASRDWRQNR